MTALFDWSAKLSPSPPQAFRQVRVIPNAELTEKDLPAGDTSWNEWPGMAAFAASFDGIRYWGSLETCVEMARVHSLRDLSELTLTQLRTCLFCLYRVLDHTGENLGADDRRRAEAILSQIRDRVRRRQFE